MKTPFKIYPAPTDSVPRPTQIATTAFAEDAAILVGAFGDGAVVKHRGRIVWREGLEHDGEASESFDAAARVMHERIRAPRRS